MTPTINSSGSSVYCDRSSHRIHHIPQFDLRVRHRDPRHVGHRTHRGALIITPATARTAGPLVRTADPTERGLTVGPAVRTDFRWPE